ncbi:MAG TPA: hypothetical protein VMW95_02690 [Desulfobacterales bacterium]|nr:hypothetical protein [Desulfobacterales bacterium]
MDIKKPQIPDFIERFSLYRKINPIWGSLHIVLADGNVKDSDVEFCRNYALEHGDHNGVFLADILMKMSKTQRRKIDMKVDEWEENAPTT